MVTTKANEVCNPYRTFVVKFLIDSGTGIVILHKYSTQSRLHLGQLAANVQYR